jgi:hypothetical protein
LPGVTDNVAHTVRESLEDKFKKTFDKEKSVFIQYLIFLQALLTMMKHNKLPESYTIP